MSESTVVIFDCLPAHVTDGMVDRYTVFPYLESQDIHERCSYLGCSEGGRAISMWGQVRPEDLGSLDHLGRKVALEDLDERTRNHILTRVNG